MDQLQTELVEYELGLAIVTETHFKTRHRGRIDFASSVEIDWVGNLDSRDPGAGYSERRAEKYAIEADTRVLELICGSQLPCLKGQCL